MGGRPPFRPAPQPPGRGRWWREGDRVVAYYEEPGSPPPDSSEHGSGKRINRSEPRWVVRKLVAVRLRNEPGLRWANEPGKELARRPWGEGAAAAHVLAGKFGKELGLPVAVGAEASGYCNPPLWARLAAEQSEAEERRAAAA